MQHVIGNLSARRDTGAIYDLTTNLALVTGRLPVPSAVTPTSAPFHHPRTSHKDVFQREVTGCVQLHTIILKPISHVNGTYCHSDTDGTTLPSALPFFPLLFSCVSLSFSI